MDLIGYNFTHPLDGNQWLEECFTAFERGTEEHIQFGIRVLTTAIWKKRRRKLNSILRSVHERLQGCFHATKGTRGVITQEEHSGKEAQKRLLSGFRTPSV